MDHSRGGRAAQAAHDALREKQSTIGRATSRLDGERPKSLTNEVKWDGQRKRKLEKIEGNGRSPLWCTRSRGRAARESDQDGGRESRCLGGRWRTSWKPRWLRQRIKHVKDGTIGCILHVAYAQHELSEQEGAMRVRWRRWQSCATSERRVTREENKNERARCQCLQEAKEEEEDTEARGR